MLSVLLSTRICAVNHNIGIRNSSRTTRDLGFFQSLFILEVGLTQTLGWEWFMPEQVEGVLISIKPRGPEKCIISKHCSQFWWFIGSLKGLFIRIIYPSHDWNTDHIPQAILHTQHNIPWRKLNFKQFGWEIKERSFFQRIVS